MAGTSESDSIRAVLYDFRANDPAGELLGGQNFDDEDLPQITQLMNALAGLRDAERKLAEASRRFMKLGVTDMKALHYLIVSENRGSLATPSGIAGHLGISTAATTKLLDRLAQAGHITRNPHPSDRRALAISVSPSTRAAAMATLGKQQAKRFMVAAQLSRQERDVVIGFLTQATAELSDGLDDWGEQEAELEG